MKDILVLRIPNESAVQGANYLKGIGNGFKKQYLVMVICGENETNKTIIEIIKA